MKFRSQYLWTALLVLSLTFIPLFLNLGTYPIQIWDESRMATSAYEMSKSNQLLIPTFQGGSELWNTKPPLLIWMQYTFIKMFGVSEFALRLPSALAGLGIFLWLTFWLRRAKYSLITAISAILLLVASSGFTGWHCLRTGDYDALLILFLIIQIGSFYFYLFEEANDEKGQKYLNITLIVTVLGVLTKSVTALFFIPMLAIWWLICKKWKSERWLRLSLKLLTTIIGCLAYYLIRELVEPGYIHWVKMNELGGRFMEGIENHNAPPNFYLNLLVSQTGFWVYTILPFLVLALTFGNKQQRLLLLYLSTLAMMFYAVIQTAQTKNIWYDVPIIPLLAMIFVVSIEISVQYLGNSFHTPVKYTKFGLALILLAFILRPYLTKVSTTIQQTEHVEHHDNYYAITSFLRAQLNRVEPLHWKFIDLEYSAHNWWYIQRLNDQGHNIKSFIHLDSIETNDVLLLNQPFVYDSLVKMYNLVELDSNPHFHLIELGLKKD